MSYRNREDSTLLGTYLMLAVIQTHQKFSKMMVEAAGEDWQKVSDEELTVRLAKFVGQEESHAYRAAYNNDERELRKLRKERAS